MAITTRPTIALLSCVAAVVLSTPPATAAVGASDTAVPNYLSSPVPTAGANSFSCTGGGCSMVIKTKTSAYPCASELVVLADTQTPGLLYQNTLCSVSISGTFEAPFGETSPTCTLEAAQTLEVAFSSGVNSAFNGRFPATGTFKPTAVNSTTRHITAAQITVKAGGTLTGNPTASGAVQAVLSVRFGGAGLSPYCYAAAPAGLTTVTGGTVVTRF